MDIERRRLPRLSLSTEQFKLEVPNQGARVSKSLTQDLAGKIFPIQDLSVSGMRLWSTDPEDLKLFPMDSVQAGHINLNREKFEVQVRVRRLGQDNVGLEFENPSQKLVQALESFLSPSLLAAALRPLPSSDFQNTLWYHGPSCTELLIKRAMDGHYNLLDIYLLGQFVHWDDADGLATGTSVSSDQRSEVQGILRIETLLLNRDPTPDGKKLGVAKKFILSSNLPLDLKTWCVRQLG